MGFWIFMLCMNLPVPLLMIGFGWAFSHGSSGEVNGFIGYRTRRSMASQEAWNFAHRYFGRLWFFIGIITLVCSVAAMLPCIGRSDDVVGIWGAVVQGAQCILLIAPIIPTEKALKKRFG